MKILDAAMPIVLGAVVPSCQVGSAGDADVAGQARSAAEGEASGAGGAATSAGQEIAPAPTCVTTEGDTVRDGPPATFAPASWGCNGPFDHHAETCDQHCRNDLRCRGGYCDAATGWYRCTCFGC